MDPTVRAKWLANIKREEANTQTTHRGAPWNPGQYTYICSDHFTANCLQKCDKITRLAFGAVPTLFEHVPNFAPTILPQCSRVSNTSMSIPLQEELDTKKETEDTRKAKVAKLMEDSKVENLKAALEKVKRERTELAYQLTKSKKVVNNQKKKMDSMKEKLKEANLMNADLEKALDIYSDIPLEIFQKGRSWSAAAQQFALTLHLYGPKAYDFLRTYLPLPSERTLRSWLYKVDASPGISRDTLAYLAQKRQSEDSVNYEYCGIMVDGMKIKEHVDYDPKSDSMIGLLDDSLGDPSSPDSFVSEVLVFMATGIRVPWKIPIGYFFINGIKGKTLAELIRMFLRELTDIAVNIVSLTLDGHASNISALQELGCSIDPDNLIWFFPNPSNINNDVCVFLDASHMLKLVRNCLGALGMIESEDGKIKWDHIVNLYRRQDEKQLKLANKLSALHINYHGKKMCVYLAAQTISRSVAMALRVLREAGDPEFKDTYSTERFLLVIDEVFDILNSRQPFGKGTKAPLRLENLVSFEVFIEGVFKYFLTLKLPNGQDLLTSRRKTPFIGFLLCLYSFHKIAHLVLPSMHNNYLCGYRFSQDHVELFFSAVRRAGGHNNNPTAKQFRYIYRRLIKHAGVVTSTSANVQQLEDGTDLLDMDDDLDLDDFVPPTEDVLEANTVTYIAGYLTTVLPNKIKCKECSDSLYQCLVLDSSTQLISTKSFGGLTYPSFGVRRLCSLTESYLKSFPNLNKICVQSKIINHIGSGLSTLFPDPHFCSNPLDSSHLLCLCKLVISTYINLKQHHFCKSVNLKKRSASIRSKATKLIHFRGD